MRINAAKCWIVSLAAAIVFTASGDVFGQPHWAPACPCDFNGNGVVDSQDVFDFLACFFAPGSLACDFNGNGVVDSQDFFDFLACFFTLPTGC